MLTLLVSILLWCVAAIVSLPILVFCLECAAACLCPPRKNERRTAGKRPPLAVIVPAHDESLVLGETLRALRQSVRADDKIFVVADNCTDDTGNIARENGVTVLERSDPTRRGKGFALNFGFEHIRSEGYPVIVVLDADCRISADSLDELGARAAASQSPVQGIYLCQPPENPATRDTISGLAFRFKNLIRAVGLSRLGGVCHLTGSGMAFPADILQDVHFMGGHIVEDMQTGIALTRLRRPPQLCCEARIESLLPDEPEAFVSQRIRWEHGHVQTMLSEAPRLIFSGLLRRRWASICLGLDLAVPPLSLLVFSWLAALAITLIAAASGATWLPSAVLAGMGALLGLTIVWGWFCFCRHDIHLSALAAAPLYALSKIPIYLKLFTRRQNEWVRTSRTGGSPDAEHSPPSTG